MLGWSLSISNATSSLCENAGFRHGVRREEDTLPETWNPRLGRDGDGEGS